MHAIDHKQSQEHLQHIIYLQYLVSVHTYITMDLNIFLIQVFK